MQSCNTYKCVISVLVNVYGVNSPGSKLEVVQNRLPSHGDVIGPLGQKLLIPVIALELQTTPVLATVENAYRNYLLTIHQKPEKNIALKFNFIYLSCL